MAPASLNDVAALWGPAMLRACWQGALAVGVVWLLCRLLPRLSPNLRATLWWLVCAKIVLGLFAIPLLPVAVLPAESAGAIAPPVPQATMPVKASAAVATDFYTVPSSLPSSDVAVPVMETPMPPPMPSALPVPELPSPLALLFLAWGAGVVTLLVMALHEQARVHRQIADARPCADLELLSALYATEGLRHMPRVLVSDTLPGSVVVGIWRPRIVLATADLADLGSEEKWALLAHELAHIRRGDLWLGILPNLARVVFFFNPAVWLAYREYELAREAACDAESLRVSGLPPADYGRLLLKLSLPPAGSALRPGVAALGVASPHAKVLLRRLQGLQRLKADGTLPQWCSLVVLALVGVLLSLTPTRAKVRNWIVPPPPAYTPAAPMEVEKAAAMPMAIAHTVGMPVKAMDMAPPTPELVQAGTAPTAVVKGNESDMKFSLKPTPGLARAVTAAAAIATVGAPTMMAARSANAQDTPPIPAVPPVPIAGVAVPAIPGLPATPASIEAPVALGIQVRKYQYTLRMGTSYSTHVQSRETAQVQRKIAEAQPGDCLVVDRDGKRYLITDAATLRQIKENYAAVEAKGKQMELKGKDMEKMGLPMEALGKQMEALGKVMEARGKEMGLLGEKMATANEAERAELQEKMKAVRDQMKMPTEEMKALGKKMRDQGDKMRIPGNELREMGNQIRAAVKEAEDRMTVILDNAFKNNLAVEQPGSPSPANGEIALD